MLPFGDYQFFKTEEGPLDFTWISEKLCVQKKSFIMKDKAGMTTTDFWYVAFI